MAAACLVELGVLQVQLTTEVVSKPSSATGLCRVKDIRGKEGIPRRRKAGQELWSQTLHGVSATVSYLSESLVDSLPRRGHLKR